MPSVDACTKSVVWLYEITRESSTCDGLQYICMNELGGAQNLFGRMEFSIEQWSWSYYLYEYICRLVEEFKIVDFGFVQRVVPVLGIPP